MKTHLSANLRTHVPHRACEVLDDSGEPIALDGLLNELALLLPALLPRERSPSFELGLLLLEPSHALVALLALPLQCGWRRRVAGGEAKRV